MHLIYILWDEIKGQYCEYQLSHKLNYVASIFIFYFLRNVGLKKVMYLTTMTINYTANNKMGIKPDWKVKNSIQRVCVCFFLHNAPTFTFTFAAKYPILEIRLHVHQVGTNTRSGTEVISSLGSFRNGKADVRLCVSCANFGSWHSYELETLRTPRIHNGSRQK